MARMLGRYQVPGCCPGTRAGRPPGPDCSGGGSKGTRAAKRAERREWQAGLAPVADLEWLASLEPALYDLSDCRHGCNGDCLVRGHGSDVCDFLCHPGL